MSRKTLYKDQRGVCPWCLLPIPADLAGTDIDHIIPRGRGGPHEPWNLQLLHAPCNRSKRTALTGDAAKLAAEHGITLHEPLPTSWPGSNRRGRNVGYRPVPEEISEAG